MFWRRKQRDGRAKTKPPLRQYWTRTPGATDALAGYVPDLGLLDPDRPAEVYPDEIDPAWADGDTTTDQRSSSESD